MVQHEAYRFLILSSFDTTLAITVEKQKYFDPGYHEIYDFVRAALGSVPSEIEERFEGALVPTEQYYLTINFADFSNYTRDIPDGNYSTREIKRYWTKLDPENFSVLISSLFESGFFATPQYYPAKRLCADGVAYWAEAKYAAHYNLVGRYWCNPKFEDDFHFAKLAIDLAKEKIPELTEKLDGLEKKIRSN